MAEICDINQIPIHFIFESHLLSTGIMYACYLVFKLPENAYVFEGIVVACFDILTTKKCINSPREHHIYLVTPPHAPTIIQRPGDVSLLRTRKIKGHPKLRKDGWMEVQLCEFRHDSSQVHVMMDGYLKSLSGWTFNGLLVQSVELRPANTS